MTDEIIGWREDGTPFRADEFMMTEKFIDLGPQIAKEAGGLSLTSLAHEHQLRVLKWLDENVDQAPGRTMTASEFGNSEIAERVRSELYGEFAGKGGRSAD